MSDSKTPTDEDIGQLIDLLFAALPSLITDLFGEPVSYLQLTKEKKEEMIPRLRDMISRFQNVEGFKEQFKEPPATYEEWRSRLDKVSNELAPIVEIPEGVHLANYLRQSYALFALAPLSIDFFKETIYSKCLSEIDEICTKAFQNGRALEIDKFFDQVFGSSDLLPLLQSYLSGFKETCDLLQKKSDRPLQRKDIQELIELYGKTSGDFEKGIRINVGILKVLEGDKPDYGKVSSQPLAANVEFLKKRREPLVQDFSGVMRNSIAHRSYFIGLSNGTVSFQDRKEIEVVTFEVLLLKCKKLIALTTALTLAPAIFMHRRWDNIWRNYNSTPAS